MAGVHQAAVCVAVAMLFTIDLVYSAEDTGTLAPILGKRFEKDSCHLVNNPEVKILQETVPTFMLTEDNGLYRLSVNLTGNSFSRSNPDVFFRMGQEFESDSEGMKVKNVITQEGNTLTHVRTGKTSTTRVITFNPQEVKVVATTGGNTTICYFKPKSD